MFSLDLILLNLNNCHINLRTVEFSPQIGLTENSFFAYFGSRQDNRRCTVIGNHAITHCNFYGVTCAESKPL